jgi:hypothetical protein
MMEDKLVRIPLQFFGENDDDEGEDLFDEEYDEEEENLNEDVEDASEGEDDGDDGAEEAEGDGEGEDTNAELIKLLKEQGYVGDDLAALTADMKKKAEDNAKKAAKSERAAAMAAGKSHIKSAGTRNLSGEGMEGFSQKDIREVSACLVKRGTNTTQRATRALERRARAK